MDLLLIVISITLIVLMFSYLFLMDKVDKLASDNNRLKNQVQAQRRLIYTIADDVYKEHK